MLARMAGKKGKKGAKAAKATTKRAKKKAAPRKVAKKRSATKRTKETLPATALEVVGSPLPAPKKKMSALHHVSTVPIPTTPPPSPTDEMPPEEAWDDPGTKGPAV